MRSNLFDIAEKFGFGVSPQEESCPLSDVYCDSKFAALQDRTRGVSIESSKSKRDQFLQGIGSHIVAGLAAKGTGEIDLGDGVTVEHLERKEFEDFRRCIGVDENTFWSSFSSVTGGASSDGGRSGALYWFSHDRRYILKTASQTDIDKLLEMMPRYTQHFQGAERSGRPCLLLRYMAAFMFEAGDQSLALICMNDVFGGAKPETIYDLKGTTHHRYVEDEAPGVVLKDLNLQSYLILDQVNGQKILAAIEADSKFLESENALDYSLLVGLDDVRLPQPAYQGFEVEDWEEEEQGNCLALPIFAQRCEEEAGDDEEVWWTTRKIRLGIIDFLGQWNQKKKAERWLKCVTAGCEEHSSMPPHYYRRRWVDFMEDHIFIQDDT
jgi:hypothetical protein